MITAPLVLGHHNMELITLLCLSVLCPPASTYKHSLSHLHLALLCCIVAHCILCPFSYFRNKSNKYDRSATQASTGALFWAAIRHLVTPRHVSRVTCHEARQCWYTIALWRHCVSNTTANTSPATIWSWTGKVICKPRIFIIILANILSRSILCDPMTKVNVSLQFADGRESLYNLACGSNVELE